MTAAQLAEKTGARLTLPRFSLLENGRFVRDGDIRARFERERAKAPVEQYLQRKESK